MGFRIFGFQQLAKRYQISEKFKLKLVKTNLFSNNFLEPEKYYI